MRNLRYAVVLMGFSSLALLPALGLAHGGEDHSAPQTVLVQGDAPQRLADGQVRLAKSSQLALQILTQPTRAQSARNAIELAATVLQNPDYPGQLAALQDGIVQAGPDGLPKAGMPVKAGQILGYLQPTDTLLDRNNQQAQAAAVAAELAVLEDTIKRLAPLADYNSRNQLEQAKLKRRGLIKQRQLLEQSVQQALPLLAPATGVVSDVLVRVGQRVSAGQLLVQLVDPTQLWLDVSWFADAAPVDPQAYVGQFSQGLPLVAMGQQREHQRLPLYFALPAAAADQPTLRLGSLLNVTVQYGDYKTGLVVPRSALVRTVDNKWQVWVKTAAETFQAIDVSFTPLDATHVLVALPAPHHHAEGTPADHQHQPEALALDAGMRLVVQGAALLSQVR